MNEHEQVTTDSKRAIALRTFAESFDISYDTAFRAARPGALRTIRVFTKILVPPEEVDRVLREGLQVRRGRPPKAKSAVSVSVEDTAAGTTAGRAGNN
jgi:hypothetical protein